MQTLHFALKLHFPLLSKPQPQLNTTAPVVGFDMNMTLQPPHLPTPFPWLGILTPSLTIKYSLHQASLTETSSSDKQTVTTASSTKARGYFQVSLFFGDVFWVPQRDIKVSHVTRPVPKKRRETQPCWVFSSTASWSSFSLSSSILLPSR